MGSVSLTQKIINRLIMIGFGWVVALAVSRVLAIIFISSEQFVFVLIGSFSTVVGAFGIFNEVRFQKTRDPI
jgi:CBS domain containing-hemolysin-like protein